LLKKLLSTTVLSLSLLILLIPAPNSYAGVGSTTVFSTDFESGLPVEFLNAGAVESTQGYSGLGFGDNFLRNTTVPPLTSTLVIQNLPCHTSVDINFLAAIIDSWDGFGGSPGPDQFNVIVDGS